MEITDLSKLTDKKLIVFDLDGTLAPTKSIIDDEMSNLVEDLLSAKKMAVIGGGKLDLFKEQFLNELKIPDELYQNLFLFPVTATSFYKWDNGWKNVYTHDLTKEEVDSIFKAFEEALNEIGYKHPEKTYGNTLENRGSQVTWSALGQDVVKHLGTAGVDLKNKWRDENTPLKLKIAEAVQKRVPNLEVHAAGHTSIDVTKKGIDKSYGLHQMEKYLNVKIEDMLFVGDAIFPGGNDYAITKTDIDYVKVKDPEDTKKVIRAVLKKS